jgi:hypothetical protein
MIPTTCGFHSVSACSASFALYPDMASGGGANTSGIALQMSVSPRMFHFDTPPMCGELNPRAPGGCGSRGSRRSKRHKAPHPYRSRSLPGSRYGAFSALAKWPSLRHVASHRRHRDPVDRLSHDHAITADHCGIWILTRFAGSLRKADAMTHHQAIDFLNVHTGSV